MTPNAPSSAVPAAGHLAAAPHARGGGWQAVRQAVLAMLPHAFAAVVVTAIGLPTLILPFWSDNAIFSVIGTAVAEGRFPYVDAWDQKPPSIYFIYAVAIQGPFGLMRNVRVFDLLWTAITVALLVELGRRWWTLRAGVIGGITYGGVYFTVSTWTQLAQPDSFIGLPLVLALLLVHGAHGRGSLLVVAGVSLGFAFQLRAIIALLIPFCTLPEVLAAPRGNRMGVWVSSMFWLGVGFSAFQLGVAAYLLVGG
ncbi:MAG: glycosyltransferase family 39 protein, partial [Dehalococcoidia bacterium]